MSAETFLLVLSPVVGLVIIGICFWHLIRGDYDER